MNVLFITRNFPQTGNPIDGLFVLELAQELIRIRVDVRVIHLAEHIPWPLSKLRRYRKSLASYYIHDPQWLIRYNITALPRALLLGNRAKLWGPRVYEYAKRCWPNFRPDFIHAHTFVPAGVVARHFSAKWHCPILIHTHGSDTRVFLRRYLTRRLILQLAKQAKAIVVVGPTIRKRLIDEGVAKNSLYVVPNGMDISKIYCGHNSLIRRYKDKRIILAVGNLIPIKGIDVLIRAVALIRPQIPNLKLLIVGDGPQHHNLQKLVTQLDLQECVDFLGKKLPNQTMAYMQACDVFCLPSWSEAFGIVYLEAMAHGKAVIAVEGQGISSIIAEHETGLLVTPRNEMALAEALQYLLNNPARSSEMGMKGAELVKREFSWERSAKKIIEIYSSLLFCGD